MHKQKFFFNLIELKLFFASQRWCFRFGFVYQCQFFFTILWMPEFIFSWQVTNLTNHLQRMKRERKKRLLLWEQYIFAFLTFLLNWNYLNVALMQGKENVCFSEHSFSCHLARSKHLTQHDFRKLLTFLDFIFLKFLFQMSGTIKALVLRKRSPQR